ncbi:MAG: type II toxin-antitoxin system RelE/ParE family toxin [Alphaproteobacteria bacterium]|jgi:plasmid stabilization system protein ParE|nr:type II toxin-antitoxin system RelE/ParE family toxin [Alphaproteobacteria bacterium]
MDIETIAEYVAHKNPHAAQRLRERIEQSVLILQHHPELGRETDFPGLRKWQIPGLPYAAYYVIDRELVRITRILHGARRWPDSYLQ